MSHQSRPFRVAAMSNDHRFLDDLRGTLEQAQDFSIDVHVNSELSEFIRVAEDQQVDILIVERTSADLSNTHFWDWYSGLDSNKILIILSQSSVEPKEGIAYLEAGAADFVHYQTIGQVTLTIFKAISFIERMEVRSKALMDSEARYTSLVENQQNCIHEIDQNGCLTTMNAAGLAMLGLHDVDEIQGMLYQNAVCDDDRPRIAGLLDKAFQGFSSTFEFKSSDKTKDQFFSSSFIPIKSDDGIVTRILGITEDTTLRVIAQKELLIRDRAFDNMHQGILITNPSNANNPIVFSNKAFERLTGYTSKEVEGKNCRFLQGPDTNPATIDGIRKAMLAGADNQCEILNYKKDGTPFWNELTITGIKSEDGKLRNYVGLIRDITKEKHAYQEIRKLSIAVEQSPASVVITDVDGKINYVNSRFEEVTGFKSEKVIGKNPRILKSGHTSKEEYAELWKTITSGNTWTGEFHNRKRDGTLYWEKASIGPIINDEGVITDYIAVKEDVTDLKMTQDLLKSSLVFLEEEVEKRTKELTIARQELQETHDGFISSLHYAKRIQMASLPSKSLFEKVFAGYGVIFRPKDVVSGDFYRLYASGMGDILAVADCTGHGVPGALMSMAGHEKLGHIIEQQRIFSPELILKELDQAIYQLLKQDDSDSPVNDGMDISIVRINRNSNTIDFGAACGHGLLYTDGQLVKLESARNSIGGLIPQDQKRFEKQTVKFNEGDRLYLFSDGIYDQFGGENGKKMMRKPFTNMILDSVDQPIDTQLAYLDQKFLEWKGEMDQVDDVTVVGVQL